MRPSEQWSITDGFPQLPPDPVVALNAVTAGGLAVKCVLVEREGDVTVKNGCFFDVVANAVVVVVLVVVVVIRVVVVDGADVVVSHVVVLAVVDVGKNVSSEKWPFLLTMDDGFCLGGRGGLVGRFFKDQPHLSSDSDGMTLMCSGVLLPPFEAGKYLFSFLSQLGGRFCGFCGGLVVVDFRAGGGGDGHLITGDFVGLGGRVGSLLIRPIRSTSTTAAGRVGLGGRCGLLSLLASFKDVNPNSSFGGVTGAGLVGGSVGRRPKDASGK